MTDDKHVRVVPTTRTSKLKEPVGVVTIEVDYVLDEKNSSHKSVILVNWRG